MQRFLAAMLVAGIIGCVSGDVGHASPPPSASPAPQSHKYGQPAPAPAPAPSPNPATPTQTYGDPQAAAAEGPSAEEQGYYYYYYPVQEDKKKGGLFDYKHDSGLMSLIIVGVLLVGGLLVALSYIQPEDARTLQVSYRDVYEMASQVYKAISKTY